jgi:hypothetical protein
MCNVPFSVVVFVTFCGLPLLGFSTTKAAASCNFELGIFFRLPTPRILIKEHEQENY